MHTCMHHPSNVPGVSANPEETVTVDGAYGMHAYIHVTPASKALNISHAAHLGLLQLIMLILLYNRDSCI